MATNNFAAAFSFLSYVIRRLLADEVHRSISFLYALPPSLFYRKIKTMFTFFRAAYENLSQTGSIIESSSRLASRMTRSVDFSKKIHVVELGAGTGSITRHLLSQINPASRLTSFEINARLFYKLQQLRHRQFVAVNDNVCSLREYVCNDTADYIISGLPLANFSPETKEHILDSIRTVLKPGGFYIQFQYSLNDRALLRRKFPLVHLGFEPINIPPAFIYYAQKQ